MPDKQTSDQQLQGERSTKFPGPTATFEEFAAFTKDDVRGDVEALDEPHGDIDPRAYLWGPREAAVVVIPQEDFDEDLKFAAFEAIIPSLVRQHKPRLFASAVTVYSRLPKPPGEFSETERRAFLDGREMPDWPPPARWARREEVLLCLLTREREEVWQAPIIRPHQQPPLLGYWATLGSEKPWSGRLLTPIREALRDDVAEREGE